jgi:hypothetical protein
MATATYTGPWVVEQIFMFSDKNASGQPATKAKFFFRGTGTIAYRIVSATARQGTISIPILVNGATTFYVPPSGRWSDLFSTTSFTLPGNVSIFTIGEGGIIPLSDDAITGGSLDGTVLGEEQQETIEKDALFRLRFEGVQGATTWLEDIGIAALDYNQDMAIDTTKHYSGVSSLKYLTDYSEVAYEDLVIPNDFRYKCNFYYDGVNSTNSEEFNLIYISNHTSWFSVGVYFNDSDEEVFAFWGDANNVFFKYESPNTITRNAWHELEITSMGRVIVLKIDGYPICGHRANEDNPFIDMNYFMLWGYATYNVWIDNIEFKALSPYEITSIVSTETITITDNSLIQAGDTITITGVSA